MTLQELIDKINLDDIKSLEVFRYFYGNMDLVIGYEYLDPTTNQKYFFSEVESIEVDNVSKRIYIKDFKEDIQFGMG
jgi:hypothetical protein